MTQVLEQPSPAQLLVFAGGHCLVHCSELINSCPAPKAPLHHKPNICCAIAEIKFITNRETRLTHFFVTTEGSERFPEHSQKVTSASSWTNSNTLRLVFTSPHIFTSQVTFSLTTCIISPLNAYFITSDISFHGQGFLN